MFSFRPNRSRANRHVNTKPAERVAQVLENRCLLAGNVLASLDSANNLTIQGDSLGNAVEITIVGGNVVVRGLQNTTINGGTANFTVATGTSTISGTTTVSLNNGNDTLLLSRNVLFRGAFSASGGQGNDSLGATRAQFQSTASFDGGTGNDRVSLRSTEAAGTLTISTGQGDDVVSLEDDTIGASFSVHTGRGNDAVSLNRVTTDADFSSIIFTGLGDDDVAIRNSTMNGVLKVWTKRGADVVVLENNTFGNTLGVNLGRDNDTFLARTTAASGSTAATLNTFNGALRVQAGQGSSDAVEIMPNNAVNGERRVRKNEGVSANTNTISTRVDNATTGVIAKGNAANTFFTGLLAITPQTLTFDNTGNTTVSSTGNTLITRGTSFIVAGTTTPLSVVTLDTNGDGIFNDGTVEADATGRFSTTVTLTRRDLDTTDTVANDQRNGLNVIAVRSTDEAGAVQNSTITVDLVVNSVVRFVSNLGTYEVEMFDNLTPNTVANFMRYFTDYTNSIIHRSAQTTPSGSSTAVPFVIQGGGFTLNNGVINDVVSKGNIQNEYNNTTSNIRGTLAMAQGSDINSGNSQWFINLRDNGTGPGSLDNVPHTVFGRVIGKGMDVVDAIAALTEFNLDQATGVTALNEVPLRNAFSALNKPLTGTVSTTTGSTLVTGVGTRFLTELTSVLGNPGGARSRISINGQTFNVQSITSDTQLVVSAAATQNNSAVVARTDTITDADFVRFSSITEILDQV